MKYPWREASTVILTALKRPPNVSLWNYELLVLQRSSESQFFANNFVFPGGVAEPADHDEAWLNLFTNFNVDLSNATKISGKVPPIIGRCSGKMPKLLSLKIAAVRETFEETGVLLCFGKDKTPSGSEKWASFSDLQDVNSWRKKVYENASEFFNMCHKLDLCPDVNNIHLWSNWLTPTSISSRRFDTAFFVASVQESPMAVSDNKEINELKWYSPDKLIKLCLEKEIWLPPPQFYEISRLTQFKDVKDLNVFAQNRALCGCERWMPIIKRTSDGSVSLLPGDGAYEITNDLTPTQAEVIELSSKEFRNQYEVLHRLEFKDKRPKIFLKNYEPKDGHLLPAEEL